MAHAKSTAIQPLTFQSTTFDVIDRNGQPWLRSHQIGVALGYKRSDIVAKLYRANADEFTDSMTALVKLPDLPHQNGVAGQTREVRIFSLRGAHLLGMFARTKAAADFRRWVLDILDQEVQPQPPLDEILHIAAQIAEALRNDNRVLFYPYGGKPRYTHVPSGSSVRTKDQWIKDVGCGQDLSLTTEQLIQIINNAQSRLHDRAQFFENRCLRLRKQSPKLKGAAA